ncbi:hypothetical protein BDV28DRAFT_147813 [Aspergillus coremiiformis]|uniref:Uncharacterized protein n=1 Tax=Aspergillus coremiiformis TaxID=138285 RepID=A0A5N6ZAH3_9EURO|nr:hypothetical protein BDV28DRAFT_147813 [Aspergillus coremiiformis]
MRTQGIAFLGLCAIVLAVPHKPREEKPESLWKSWPESSSAYATPSSYIPRPSPSPTKPPGDDEFPSSSFPWPTNLPLPSGDFSGSGDDDNSRSDGVDGKSTPATSKLPDFGGIEQPWDNSKQSDKKDA